MENYEAKKRYKMYKAGKNWVVAPLVFLGLAMGVSVHNPKVMADTNVQSQTDNNNNNQTNKQEVTLQATQNTEAKTVVNQENSSQQASVESNQSVETNTNGVVDTTQQTSTNQEVKQSTPVTVQAQSAPVQQAAPANNNVTAQVTENKVATAPATSATTSEQSQNTQVVNNSEQNSAAQSSTTQESEEPKVETPVNTADNASQKNVDGNWYLVDNNTGKNLTGFQEIKDQNKVVYYAPSNAQMQYGWQNINGKNYYFDTISGAMKTGTVNINGKNYTFNSDGTLKQDTWGWPFPSVGQGSFTGAQLFGVNPGGEFRANGFHDGLDFGSYDHPGSSVHAVHSGVVTQIGYIAGLENYVVVQSDEYSFVYQEAFSNRGNIKVRVGQQINTGDVIGYRDTSHLHLGITREKNIMRAIANSFNNNGTWLNPLELIRNGIANQ